jgi:hypothetical protein
MYVEFNFHVNKFNIPIRSTVHFILSLLVQYLPPSSDRHVFLTVFDPTETDPCYNDDFETSTQFSSLFTVYPRHTLPSRSDHSSLWRFWSHSILPDNNNSKHRTSCKWRSLLDSICLATGCNDQMIWAVTIHLTLLPGSSIGNGHRWGLCLLSSRN